MTNNIRLSIDVQPVPYRRGSALYQECMGRQAEQSRRFLARVQKQEMDCERALGNFDL